MDKIFKYARQNRKKSLDNYLERKEYLSEKGISLLKIDKKISRLNKKFFTSDVINIRVNNFNIIVHWVPEHNEEGHFESWLIYKNKFINAINSGFYEPEYYPKIGYAHKLMKKLGNWFKIYIDPKNYGQFIKDSYSFKINYKDKSYSFKKNTLICNDGGEEIFRKKVSRGDIIAIEKSPLNNGILVLSKIKRFKNQEIEDMSGDRTSSIRLIDENGKIIWFAERYYKDKSKKNLEYYIHMKIDGHQILLSSWESIVRLNPINGNVNNGHPNK